jgi:hypothetical protein
LQAHVQAKAECVLHRDAQGEDNMNEPMGHVVSTSTELEVNAASIRAFAGRPSPHTECDAPPLQSESAMVPTSRTCYEIRFSSLFNEGRALTFPCDEKGHVELDALSEKARNNYLYARAVVGREYSAPAILVSDLH